MLLWKVDDFSESSLGVSSSTSPQLAPRHTFVGHSGCVGDVSFSPLSGDGSCVFASVGDDRILLLWDARVGHDPVIRVCMMGSRLDTVSIT